MGTLMEYCAWRARVYVCVCACMCVRACTCAYRAEVLVLHLLELGVGVPGTQLHVAQHHLEHRVVNGLREVHVQLVHGCLPWTDRETERWRDTDRRTRTHTHTHAHTHTHTHTHRETVCHQKYIGWSLKEQSANQVNRA